MRFCNECGSRELKQLKRGFCGGRSQQVGCRNCGAVYEQTTGGIGPKRNGEQWRKLDEPLTLFDLGGNDLRVPDDAWGAKETLPDEL